MKHLNKKLGIFGWFLPETCQFENVRDFKRNRKEIKVTRKPIFSYGECVAVFNNYLIWNSGEENSGTLSDLTGTIDVSLKSEKRGLKIINSLEEHKRIYPELLISQKNRKHLWLFRYYENKPRRL